MITGDVIPADMIAKNDKLMREDLALMFMEAVDTDGGGNLKLLWQEYVENKTAEAQIVHDCDKLQRLDKAFEYSCAYPDLDFNDFKTDIDLIKTQDVRKHAESTLSRWEESTRMEPRNFIFVVGGPGVGKGTQCARAAEALTVAHVNAGELLREEVDRPDSPYSAFISRSFKESIPVPPLLMVSLLQEKIACIEAKTILMDGYPRSLQQLEYFEKRVSIGSLLLLPTNVARSR